MDVDSLRWYAEGLGKVLFFFAFWFGAPEVVGAERLRGFVRLICGAAAASAGLFVLIALLIYFSGAVRELKIDTSEEFSKSPDPILRKMQVDAERERQSDPTRKAVEKRTVRVIHVVGSLARGAWAIIAWITFTFFATAFASMAVWHLLHRILVGPEGDPNWPRRRLRVGIVLFCAGTLLDLLAWSIEPMK